MIALDYVNGGGKLIIGGEEFIPIYFHTNFIAHPDPTTNVITGFIFEDPLCYNLGEVPKDFLVLFPLDIPANATFLGNVSDQGVLCSKWMWDASYDDYGGEIEMWISYKDSSIVRIFLRDLPYVDTVEWVFFATQVGPFDPSVYAIPSICSQMQPRPGLKPLGSEATPIHSLTNLLKMLSFKA